MQKDVFFFKKNGTKIASFPKVDILEIFLTEFF